MQIKRSNGRTSYVLVGEDKTINLASSGVFKRNIVSLTSYYRGLLDKELGNFDKIIDTAFTFDGRRNRAQLSQEFIGFLRDYEHTPDENL